MSTAQKWWKCDEHDVKDVLWASYKRTAEAQAARHDKYKRNMRLYGGKNALPGGAPSAYLATSDGQELISLNVIASVSRSLRAKITEKPSAPWVLTSGATHKQHRNARKLQKYLVGAMSETCLHDKMEHAFDFWACCGQGFLKLWHDEDGLTAECVYPWELFWSDQSGYYRGGSRNLYQRSYVDRDYMIELYPEHEDELLACKRSDGDRDFAPADEYSDMIEVCEAWHLPASTRSTDGRHAIATESCVVFNEEWTRKTAPFVQFMGEKELVGSHGVGIADELEGIQMSIIETLDKIQEGQRGGGHVVVLVEAGAKVNDSKLTNELFSVLEYTGNVRPDFVIVPTVSQEVYAWLKIQIDYGHSIYGTSQLSAQSMLPAGVTSGRGMRVLRATETQRYSYVTKAYDRFMLDACDRIMAASADMSKTGQKVAVKAKHSSGIDRIAWSDIELDREEYSLDIQTQNFLAEQGVGRIEEAQELASAGVVDSRAIRGMMANPDLESIPDPYSASLELAHAQVDRIIENGEPQQADDMFQDLATAIQVAAAALCRAETWEDVPKENVELLKDYIAGATEKLAAQQEPVTAAPTGAEGQ